MIQNSYSCLLPGGTDASELALSFDAKRDLRVLIVPALLDEANRMRRFTVEVMRRLDGAGIDSILPDLPGCNESSQALDLIELEDWRMAIEAIAREFGATHILAIRGGCLLVPETCSGWFYAPTTGTSLIKTMLRARILASREAGEEETIEGLLQLGIDLGLDLAGWSLSGEMIRQLQTAVPSASNRFSRIEQGTVGGGGLWLRTEPDYEAAQADALSAIVVLGAKA